MVTETFAFKDLVDVAEKRFIEICGFDRGNGKINGLKDNAFELQENIKNIKISVIYKKFNHLKLKSNCLTIEDTQFHSDAFDQMEESEIRTIYLYALTSGEHACNNTSIMDSYFIDAWYTSFVESARIVLGKKFILENPESILIDSIAPGIHGMPIEELGNILKLVNGNHIGIDFYEQKIMKPVKSLAGLFLMSNRNMMDPPNNCMKCFGNSLGCRMCVGNNKDVS